MDILKGVAVAKAVTAALQNEVQSFARAPKLVIIRVGENPSDLSYENGALKRMAKVGIDCEVKVLAETCSKEEFLALFDQVNTDDTVDGILVFRPLPKSLDGVDLENRIDPAKDVDCISPKNMELVFEGKETVYPCTAEAVMEMIDYAGIQLSGKRVAVIGRSMVIGRPVAMMCLHKNATVTICHSRTENLPSVVSEADVVIACVGRAKMVDDTFIKEGAAVFDVGINVLPDGSLAGDVDFDSVSEKASLITPVPGGVGAVTTTVLAKHVVENYKRKMKNHG